MPFRFNQWKKYYNKNVSSRFKIIKRHETELKWIKAAFPLGSNDTIYDQSNISKLPDFDVFLSLILEKKTQISWFSSER